jgi:hypothetical protein
MNLNEIEAREKEINSVILFDESDAEITGIEFQRSTSDGRICIIHSD